MPSVVQRGRTKPAPLPSAGQMAPKMYAEAVLWSLGADGRVPRLAQRRVILFFCPIRASSANQISSGLPRASAFASSSRRAGKFFKSGHRRLVLRVMARAGPMGVELHHPVAHDLHRDPADPGRRGAGCSIVDRGQRQKAPRLRAVLGRAGDRAQRLGIKVCPERNRHGEPPSFATLNQTCLKPTRPNRVTPSGPWYKRADYVLALKGNQGPLREDVELFVAEQK